jgi:hypothetical protein
MGRALLFMGLCGLLLGLLLLPQRGAVGRQLARAVAPQQTSWRSGGTLYDATGAEWLAASDDNQLATAADWALAFPSVQVALEMRGDPEELLGFADTLRSCVSNTAALGDEPAAPPRASEIAARCAVALDWVMPE